MAQTYTLEEAAQRLGLSLEDFKRRLKDEWKSVRSFRDGPTLRYRAPDIDELARMLGEASDPGLQLGSVGSSEHELDASDASDHFSFTDEPPAPVEKKTPAPKAKPPADEAPLLLDSAEDFAFGFDNPPPSSVKVEKTGTDSNVKVDPPTGSGRHTSPKSGAGAQPVDEIHLDISGPPSSIARMPGASSKHPGGSPAGGLSGPKSQKNSGPVSGKIPGPTAGAVNPEDGSSDYELSLDADSDSFELNLGSESDEVDLGLDLSPPPGADRGGLSGINLGRPADSGISLERPSGMIAKPGGSKPSYNDPDLDFDLSADSPADSDVSGPKTSLRMEKPKSNNAQTSSLDSDSEFELTLDDNSGVVDSLSEDLLGPRTSSGDASQGDIFETDFEIPAMEDDSESDVIAVDEYDLGEGETSDFDLAISDADAPADDESGSEVIVVDDEMELIEDGDGVVVEEDAIGAYDDLEQGASASQALRGASPYDDYDDQVVVEGGPVQIVEAAPAPWGPLPALVLLPCLLLVFIGSLMSFELLRGMWGYHQPTPPGNVIVRGMANAMGFQTRD